MANIRNTTLDQVDINILNLLQSNARLTIKEISSQLNLSSTPIYERIKKLEKLGIIDKYVALLNQEKLGKKLNAFAQISLKDHSKPAVKEFVDCMVAFPQVMEFHYVSGGADFLIKVVVNDIEQYNHFILDKLSEVPNISKIETLMSLSIVKKTTELDLG